MNLTIKNILVNCFRDLSYCYALFSYICSRCISAIHSNTRISFAFLVYPGEAFFYSSHGEDAITSQTFIKLYEGHQYPVAFLVSRFPLLAHTDQSTTKQPFTPERDKNSILENFSKCGQCPRPDNPRPYKRSYPITEKSLIRKGSSAGLPYELMLVCNALDRFNWFYRDKGAM